MPSPFYPRPAPPDEGLNWRMLVLLGVLIAGALYWLV